MGSYVFRSLTWNDLLKGGDAAKLKDSVERLERYRADTTEFIRNRTRRREQNRHRQSLQFRRYVELASSLRSPDSRLDSDGLLERTLREAEDYLVWSQFYVWLRMRLDWTDTLGDSFPMAFREDWCHSCELSNLEKLLDVEQDMLESLLDDLRPIGDALDEERRQFETYMERLEWFIREVSIRLQMVYEFLLILCKSSGLPKKDQPLCTTMPWNILPALIVLWSVCWMFYSPQDCVDPREIQEFRADGNVGFSIAGRFGRFFGLPVLCADI